MHSLWCDETIDYDGSQLRAHWLLSRFGLVGDAIVGFRGACNVLTDEVADLADVDGPGIRGDDMVHFIWESFAEPNLLLAMHRQRLLSAQAREVIKLLAPDGDVTRTGDDLFVCKGGSPTGKLSISIATVSPVSALIHFAVNARSGGAPVAIASLAELDIEPETFARALLSRVLDEQQSIVDARAKVRPKGEWR